MDLIGPVHYCGLNKAFVSNFGLTNSEQIETTLEALSLISSTKNNLYF